jgi:hypothetical protein
MHKILKYFYKNLFSLLIIIFIIVYLIVMTPDLKHAAAVVFALYIFLGSMFISMVLSRQIFYENVPVSFVMLQNKISIALFITSCIFLYLLKGWVFLSAFLTGALIFLIFFTLLYILKRKFKH